MVRVLSLTFGYAEHARMAAMNFLYQGGDSLPSLREALTDLAHGLLEKYKADERLSEVRVLKKCCATTKSKDAEAHFCIKCGKNLQCVTLDIVAFEQWLRSLPTFDNNDYGGEEAGYWWPNISICEAMAYKDELVEINERAEKFLIASLDPVRLTSDEREALAEGPAFEADWKDLDRSDENMVCRYGKDVKLG